MDMDKMEQSLRDATAKEATEKREEKDSLREREKHAVRLMRNVIMPELKEFCVVLNDKCRDVFRFGNAGVVPTTHIEDKVELVVKVDKPPHETLSFSYADGHLFVDNNRVDIEDVDKEFIAKKCQEFAMKSLESK